MGKVIDIDEELRKLYIHLGSTLQDEELRNCFRALPSIKLAFIQGMKVAAQDSEDCLRDYATALAGTKYSLDYDDAADSLRGYWQELVFHEQGEILSD